MQSALIAGAVVLPARARHLPALMRDRNPRAPQAA
jgi:hypothetical protein